MPLTETTCPECGAACPDGECCRQCSAEPAENLPANWLSTGDLHRAVIEGAALPVADLAGAVEVSFKLQDMLENVASRRVFIATVSEVAFGDEVERSWTEDSLQAELRRHTFLLEEFRPAADVEDDEEELPEVLTTLVRRPIVRQLRGEHRVAIYVDNAGMTLEEIVDISRSRLSYPEVRDIFAAVLELAVKLHDSGYLHLRLAPWNLRILDVNAEDGFPKCFLQRAIGTTSGTDPHAVAPGLAEDTFSEADELEFQENPFASEGFGDRGATQVDLAPVTTQQDVAEATSATEGDGETTDGYADDMWDDGDGLDGAPSEPSQGLDDLSVPETEKVPLVPEFAALFDGVTDFYEQGEAVTQRPIILGFSPPEMMGRSRAPIGEASDIFSLGMVLYYLIAGQQPPASVYTRHTPAIPARNFHPSFPPGLQAIIAKATRPHPDERYHDIHAMRVAFHEACRLIEQRATVTEATAPVVRLAADTHIGIAKRRRNPTNQDSIFAASSDDGRFALIVIADGVSTASYGSGDIASQALAIEAEEIWEDILPAYLMDEDVDDAGVIHDLLARANMRIVDYINDNFRPFRGSPHEVMGTTALVAVYRDGVITLGSLGDSRVYLQRGPGLEQITIDHNLWTLSILEGVAADSALAMPHGDALARCLGTFVIREGALLAVPPQPDLFRFTVTHGDTLLVTTDGLVDFAGANLLAAEDNILSVLLSESDPALCCLEMILLANRGGGGDNIGLAIAKFL